jgi:hypothetical protein
MWDDQPAIAFSAEELADSVDLDSEDYAVRR